MSIFSGRRQRDYDGDGDIIHGMMMYQTKLAHLTKEKRERGYGSGRLDYPKSGVR